MALIVKSGLVTYCELRRALSGSLSPTNYTPTLRVRKRKSVKRAPTPCQIARRVHFRSLSLIWRGFSTAQKDAWTSFSLSYPLLNRCGTTYFLSGYRMFVKVNGVLLSFGQSYVKTSPPANLNPPSIGITPTFSYSVKAYHPSPVLILNFTAPAGQGVQCASIPGTKPPNFARGMKNNLVFSDITDTDIIT